MASITERNGRYLARVRRDGFKAIAKTFTKKTDATAWARGVEADMEAGRWVEPENRVPTLAEAIKVYRETVAVKMKGFDTYIYRYDEFAATSFAAKPINEVTARDLSLWRDEQAESLKPSTVVRKLAILSGVFTWAAKERGWLTTNPLSMVRRPRMGEGRTRTLSAEEFDCLMAAAKTSKAQWLPFALAALVRSAMRRGELFALKRTDVDFAAAVARLHDTKNGAARDVPLCPQTVEALRALDVMAAYRGDEALLPVGVAGSVSTRFIQTVKRARVLYGKACDSAGAVPDDGFLADVRLHDLRHCAVSHWAASGALSLPELMAISGHKTPRMLTRYAHMQASTLAAKMSALGSPTSLVQGETA